MKSRGAKSVAVGLAVVAVAFLSFVTVPAAREQGRRTKCRNVMHCCLPMAIRMYAMDHSGAFPSNIQDMAGYLENPVLFVCPSSGTKTPASMSVLTDWIDYIYVFWPTGESTPTNYPLLFDRRLSNHQDQGINVGKVSGEAFWDANAEWLRKFAKEHPDLKISLPEDLK